MNRLIMVSVVAALFCAFFPRGARASGSNEITAAARASPTGARSNVFYDDSDSTDIADSTNVNPNRDSLIRRCITVELAIGHHSRISHAPQFFTTLLTGLTQERWQRVHVGGRIHWSAAVGLASEVAIRTDTGFIDTPYGNRRDIYAAVRIEVLPFLNFNLCSGLGLSTIELVHVGDFERLKTWGVSPAAFAGASLDFPPIFLEWALSASTADVSSFTGAEGSTILHYFLVGVRLNVD